MKEFAAAEWQRACGALAAAKQLLGVDANSAASRAYYAAFHATRALLALRGQTFSKHSAVRAAVHRDLVKTGKWPADLGRAYEFLIDLRHTGDYGGIRHVSGSDAESAIIRAEEVIEAVRQSCPDL